METSALIDKGLLNIAAGSILASGVLALIFVLRENNTILRGVFGVIGLLLLAWAFFLFTETDDKTAKCKRTLSQLQGLAEGKLVSVGDKAEAQAIANQMLKVINDSPCKP
jgi:hypothetical protein